MIPSAFALFIIASSVDASNIEVLIGASEMPTRSNIHLYREPVAEVAALSAEMRRHWRTAAQTGSAAGGKFLGGIDILQDLERNFTIPLISRRDFSLAGRRERVWRAFGTRQARTAVVRRLRTEPLAVDGSRRLRRAGNACDSPPCQES